LVIGATYIDEFFLVSNGIGKDYSVSVSEKRYNLGGSGFSWAMALKRLNQKVSLVTVLGTCKWSKIALHIMRQSGISALTQIRKREHLDCALVIVDENNSKLVVSDRRISLLLRWTPALASTASNMDAVVLTSALKLAEVQTIVSTLPPQVFVTLAPNKQMCSELVSIRNRD
jgi:sugar/nucleoside kinase (ribokinase family)